MAGLEKKGNGGKNENPDDGGDEESPLGDPPKNGKWKVGKAWRFRDVAEAGVRVDEKVRATRMIEMMNSLEMAIFLFLLCRK